MIRISTFFVCIWLGVATASAREPVDFSRDIRPILSDKCFQCHGPNDDSREAGLRLDLEEAAKEVVLVPGEPDESELYARITSEDESLTMPPVDSEKTLSAEEIEKIRLWIEQGAPYSGHWAFVTPKQPELPKVQREDWPHNPIDFFILARLEKEGLIPSPEADKRTLLRRVTLDLTGLPPTPQEVEAFVADNSPRAYEKAVDRLLQSPRYGEHMARFWLDAARYGDTHGLHLDNYREMWPYRDWVVRAFQANMPYDQFVIEQLAGDLLLNPSLDQLVATGFNRAHVTTNEGGSIKEEVFVRNVVDRVVTTGTVLMGMTFECTRCHDHKYDPFTMEDFYSLSAYFNSLDGDPMDGNRKDHAPVVQVPTPETLEKAESLDEQIAQLEEKMASRWPEIDELQTAWEQSLATEDKEDKDKDSKEPKIILGRWHTIGPFTENRRYLVRRNHGPEGKPVRLDQTFAGASGELRWSRRPDWQDGQLHNDLPGDVAANFLYRAITASQPGKLEVSLGSDDGIKVYLNQKQVLSHDKTRALEADQHQLTLDLKEGENELLIKIMNLGGASGYYFRVADDQAAQPEALAALQTEPSARSDEQTRRLREYYRFQVADAPPVKEMRQKLQKLRQARADALRDVPVTLIWRETQTPRPAHVLKRGEYDQKGQEVSRRTPEVLPPMDPGLPNDRLGLAKWLVDRDHPLTARVAVNRFWQQVFGTGIVKTAEDFGSQGEPPSHPQLLDWLAVQFIEDGWNVKETMKRIVMSATYRQSSKAPPELYRQDPGNRLLARGPRYRLDAEMLRDQALFVSGLLVEKQGGPSVKPPQPDGLWFAVGYSGSNTVRFQADTDPEKTHRRSLYTFIKRTAPPPQMSTFDAPSREACTVRRERTNTPLQALLLMNDPQYVEAAQALARRTMREGGATAEQRAAYMFRLCTTRPPQPEELSDLVQDYEDHLAHYQQDAQAAKSLIGAGGEQKLDASELAAWTLVANLMLNLDEVINKN